MKFLDKIFSRYVDHLNAIKKAMDLELDNIKNDNKALRKDVNHVSDRINGTIVDLDTLNTYCYGDLPKKLRSQLLKIKDENSIYILRLGKELNECIEELKPMIKQWKIDHPKRKRGRPRKVKP